MELIPNYDEWKTSQPEPKPSAYCDICGEPLYEGDYLTDIDGVKWCDECLRDNRRAV